MEKFDSKFWSVFRPNVHGREGHPWFPTQGCQQLNRKRSEARERPGRAVQSMRGVAVFLAAGGEEDGGEKDDHDDGDDDERGSDVHGECSL